MSGDREYIVRELERTIDGAIAKLAQHEAVCAERYKEIKDELEDAARERDAMRNDIRTLLRYGGALIGLIALTAVFEAKDIIEIVKTVFRGGTP